jgi:hypothetical protein
MDIEEFKKMIDEAATSLKSARGRAAVFDTQNIIDLFVNEFKKSPLWKRDLTFLNVVLSTLKMAVTDEDEWYIFRNAFAMDGVSLNCMTPVKQLIYTKYLASAEENGEAEKISKTLPVLALNQYMTNKKIGMPRHPEAIEIQAAMVNLLLSNSKTRETDKNCRRLPLSGYNAFDAKMITKYEEFGYDQLTLDNNQPFKNLVKAKLIYPVESNDKNSLFQINHSVLQYAIATGLGVHGRDKDYELAKAIYKDHSSIEKHTWLDEDYISIKGSYGEVDTFPESHIAVLIKYSRVFLTDNNVIVSVVESIICDNELIGENLECIKQRGILSSEAILQRLHEMLASKLVTDMPLLDISSKPTLYRALLSLEVIDALRFLQATHTMSVAALRCVLKTGTCKIDDINKICSAQSEDYSNLKLSMEYKTYQAQKEEIPNHLKNHIHTVIISDDTDMIEHGAFEDLVGLENMVLPASVKNIGGDAFLGCQNLTSINIPDGVKSIGSSAFEGCTNLKSMIIPYGVENIGSSAFENCKSLENIILPASVKSIGYDAFSGCCNLKSINIPVGVKRIETGAFSFCSSLESINIPNTVEHIGYLAFENCTSLKRITIPDSVMNIENSFEGCNELAITISKIAYARLKCFLSHEVEISKKRKRGNAPVFSGAGELSLQGSQNKRQKNGALSSVMLSARP